MHEEQGFGRLTVTFVLHDRSLAQQLNRTFALFGAVVGGAFVVLTVSFSVSLGWLAPDAQRSRSAGRAEGAAYAAMLDEENGLRAYLLVHDAQFLEPYTRGQLALARAHEDLLATIGSIAELAAPLLNTRLAEERWHERWAKFAAETTPGEVGPSGIEGKVLFDAYRADEAVLADAIHRRTETLSRHGEQATAVRFALVVVVFFALLFLTWRNHRALRGAVVEPVARLLKDIGRIRDGQLETSADHEGPRELRELGRGLNEMVGALAAAREIVASRGELLGEHSTRLRQILDASREFSESLNLTYVVGAVRASTKEVGGYQRVIVWLMDEDQKRLFDADQSKGAAEPSADAIVEWGHGLSGRAAKAGRITFEGADGHVRFNDSNKGLVRAISIPLIVGARVVGALEARHAEPRPATGDAVEVLEMLATHAATAIESARLHELTEERSQKDALTRLFNRRRLDEDLDAECRRCVRYGRPLAFVMLDIDHFKTFNDIHGHPQADLALQDVAEVMAAAVRTTDTAYRYGGEEFCILLRETTGKDGMIFAERLRHRIQQRFASGPQAGLTASFGVAEFSANAPTPRELVEAADTAMYESKHAGRNRVALSSPPPTAGPVLDGELEVPLLRASNAPLSVS